MDASGRLSQACSDYFWVSTQKQQTGFGHKAPSCVVFFLCVGDNDLKSLVKYSDAVKPIGSGMYRKDIVNLNLDII